MTATVFTVLVSCRYIVRTATSVGITATVIGLCLGVVSADSQQSKIVSAALPATSSVVSADSSEVRLSIDIVDHPEGVINVPASPGSTHRVPVTLRNKVDQPVEARTYAANPVTVNNGGFTTAEWGVKKVGATRWVDYPDDTLTLAGNTAENRTAVINVPRSAQPGEYVVGLVIQNAKPTGTKKEGGIQLGQIRRQSVAIIIKVPGKAKPGVTFGGASYRNNSGKFFVVDLGVANTGNRILRSDFVLTLKDAQKNTLKTFSHTMPGFYPETSTKLEMNLEDPLPNGQYYVDATMTGGGLTESADATNVPFTVDEQANVGSGGSPAPPTPVWVFVLIGLIVLVLLIFAFWWLRRRRKQSIQARAAIPQTVMTADVLAFLGDRALGFRGDPVGRLTVALSAPTGGGLDVVTGDEGHVASSSGALEAVDSSEALTATAAKSALVTTEVLYQANAVGDAYSGPATLIAVADPQAELEAIQQRFLYQK